MGVGLAGLVKLATLLPFRIRLHASGIEVRQSRGSVVSIAFADIAVLRSSSTFWTVNAVPLGTYSSLRIETTDGRRVTLVGRGYGFDISPVVHRIASMTFERRLQHARARLQRHEPVTCGAFSLTSDGIQLRRTALPWSQLGGVRIENGRVVIVPTGAQGPGWLLAPRYSDLDNGDVALRLVQERQAWDDKRVEQTSRRRRPLRTLLLLAGFLMLGAVSIGGVHLVSVRTGAELGGACHDGDVFPCRNHRFNDARCLQYRDEPVGYCTRRCDSDASCPAGWSCTALEFGSRAERVCVRPARRRRQPSVD